MALARSARVASRAAIATRALVGAAPVRGMVTMSDRERAMEVSAAVLASPRAFGWFACRGGASSALELHSRRRLHSQAAYFNKEEEQLLRVSPGPRPGAGSDRAPADWLR